MVYGDSKDLFRRTTPDNVLCDKTFNVATNPKHDGHQCGLALTVYNFFHKKSATLANSSAAKTGTRIISGKWNLVEESHKPNIRKFKKWKVYSTVVLI